MPDVGSLIARGAALVQGGFARYHEAFLTITARARGRFERREWKAGLADAAERLQLYERVIGEVVGEIGLLLDARARDPEAWAALRAEHSRIAAGQPAAEIAETFFNSVTRRVFRTVGTNPAIEYLDFRFQHIPDADRDAPTRAYPVPGPVAAAVRDLLADVALDAPWVDAEGDARLAAREIDRAWGAGGAPLALQWLEVLEPVFYRRKGAYLVGRARGGNRVMPVVLALVHGPAGVTVDAALLSESDVSVVFSFTRSHFQVAVRRPADVIGFLRTLMPVKPIGELYTSLGYHKHGKTEFYRDLQRHLARTTELFERAPGERGLVMEVFTLPSFDMVFKVIRDAFPAPKQTTPEDVMQRYRLVFGHDRAGRLVDAQLFEGLSFPKARFSRLLLAELLASSSRTVRVEGDQVVFARVYAERRVRPLDLYLRDAEAGPARDVALDYGQAIRDLAATGIFPGDLLLKNFGVTRHGRVVFYDYDELRLLSECRFLELPAPRSPEEEVADEPWFSVGANDVFPEELASFVPFDGAAREAFLGAHGGLHEPGFWRDMQARAASGEVVDIFPYGQERRLRAER
jgi:isocitrate dehydrogenase kinase/phosphatase